MPIGGIAFRSMAPARLGHWTPQAIPELRPKYRSTAPFLLHCDGSLAGPIWSTRRRAARITRTLRRRALTGRPCSLLVRRRRGLDGLPGIAQRLWGCRPGRALGRTLILVVDPLGIAPRLRLR